MLAAALGGGEQAVCLFFDVHGDFRMTLKTNVPPREAAAPSIVERERECVIRTPRWSKRDSNRRSHSRRVIRQRA